MERAPNPRYSGGS